MIKLSATSNRNRTEKREIREREAGSRIRDFVDVQFYLFSLARSLRARAYTHTYTHTDPTVRVKLVIEAARGCRLDAGTQSRIRVISSSSIFKFSRSLQSV